MVKAHSYGGSAGMDGDAEFSRPREITVRSRHIEGLGSPGDNIKTKAFCTTLELAGADSRA